ncbi:MAG TPA: MFS transporter [Acidiphilium sp.]|nr:MAG: MFS transporter [Acidiphilium sp. 21-60-14]OYV91038.1 MAG: MFS transporter [Acidiphilium sp. 37-60-79]HQT87828.1 MFS transporter [Acidiphilium sp.]HQU23783.1 MFS transporter [Acidiphilium sp.]
MSPPAEPVQIGPQRGAWFAATILSLGYLLAFADRTVISLLVVPIEHDLQLSDVQMGLLQGTAFALFYAGFGLPIAWAIDRLRRNSIVAGGILVWSVMTGLCGLATGFAPFLTARIGVGAGEATILPGATSMIADYFPPAQRGRVLGVFASGIYLGSAAALIVGGILLHYFSAHHLRLPLIGAVAAWQSVFLAIAAPGILLAIVALWMREPVRLTPHRPGFGFLTGFTEAGGALVTHMIGFTAIAFASYAATAWLPTIFIREHGWTAAQIGLRFGLVVLVIGPIGSIFGGWLADRLERAGRSDGKFLVGIIAGVGVIPSAMLVGFAPGAGLAFVGVLPVIFFTSFVWGVAPGALQEIIHGAVLGRVTAIYTAILNLVALGLGPLSVAVLASMLGANLGVAMAIIAPLAGLVAAIAFALGRGPYRARRAALSQIIKH